ncbi:uncharacterized protein LOC129598662 [Paramacrobiotus metropolitanus]|uniref:uncharacterized protein LOC129598662 n=1 Tax=Paramacrobiotus metropolitanus TaxID=2943436 RepID=UPI0024465155|nr:uncharacterized protein LOC129598662 [Paramacrobiotus metropolitanus]XP_055352639.1 uncharacterized protein LOC129598662 [Paramacrobiotus metropolitanus]
MSRYQPLLTDANQMSYRNTVVVRSRTGTWWLGYIQDIDGDYAFIHFNSKIMEARWMQMSDVWPLPSYWDTEFSSTKGYQNVQIFAALCDEDNGPFCFRPAVILNRLEGCDAGCWMFYIKIDMFNTSVPAHKVRFEMVHEDQVATELPPTGPSLLDRRKRLQYTKHFIPFDQAKAVLTEPSDKFRIIKHAHYALQGRMMLTREYLSNWCRFHLRIEQEGCMFVIVGLATDAETTHHVHPMPSTLLKILETHLAKRAELPSIDKRTLHASENVPCYTDFEVDTLLMLTPSIRDLTPSLLSDILSHLDLHSRMKAKRVCALWHLLLSSSRMMEHISISFESCWEIKADSDNCFKLASMLSRSISATTRSITVLKVFPPHNASFLGAMLDAMKIELPLLVFKDHTNVKPLRFLREKQSFLKHGIAVNLVLYKRFCKFVVLQNWTVTDLFGQQMYDIFVEPTCYESCSGVTSSLPAHERSCMMALTRQSHKLAIDELQISIPKLFLPCSEKEMHMTSRFMCALNDNFPPVTEDMLAKVTAIHARWLRNLTYPKDWQSIRNYLLLFSGFNSDGRPKVWDEVDLRVVDVSAWSKMAIFGINEVFRV